MLVHLDPIKFEKTRRRLLREQEAIVRLCTSMLIRTAHDLRTYKDCCDIERKELFEDAKNWIGKFDVAEDIERPMTFVWICGVLSKDPIDTARRLWAYRLGKKSK